MTKAKPARHVCPRCPPAIRAAIRKKRNQQRAATYYKQNREKVQAHVAEYRSANIEKVRAYDVARYKVNPTKRRAHTLSWVKVNPTAVRASVAKRHAMKRAAEVGVTAEQRAAIIDVYDTRELASRFMGSPFHVDHREPLARGGSHTADNLQHLPAAINLKKHAMSHAEALERVPGYRDWVEGPDVFKQVTWVTYRKGNPNAPPLE